MKIKTIILSLLLLGIISTFTSCSKDDTKPAATSGGLVVKVKLAGATGYLTGVVVGLATSIENFDNSIYLHEKITNSNGVADFGQLNSGNYYYDCYYVIGGTKHYGEGQVQIVAGTNLELTVTIE